MESLTIEILNPKAKEILKNLEDLELIYIIKELDTSTKSLKSKTDPKDDEKRDRYIRWQQLSINQLSITNNIILTLSLAFLMFLLKTNNNQQDLSSYLIIIKLISFGLLFISLIVGVLLTVNRLKDFKKTAYLIKLRRQKNKSKIVGFNICQLENQLSVLGKRTWLYLYIQLWTFLMGSILGLFFNNFIP
jgi:glycosyltransferase involved in cell wall biosynthesis